MTESYLIAELIRRLHLEFPRVVVLKHCDRFTAGIPDLSVSTGGYTTWLEVKLVRPRENLWDLVRELQLMRLRMLDVATHGRAWLLVYYAAEALTEVWKPNAAWHAYKGTSAAPARKAPVRAHHDLIIDLIRETHR